MATWGALALGLSAGCELVVGDLPEASDIDGGASKLSQGGARAAGGSGQSSGGVAIGNTGGEGAVGTGNVMGAGGSASDAGGSNRGAQANAGGNAGAGGAVGTGGSSNAGGSANTGGARSTGGRSSTGGNGGVATTGGAPGTGGATGCRNPPCDCDGDGGVAVSCGGDDCDDTDPLVYKNEPTYYGSASLHHGFDYDCNGSLDVYPAVNKTKDCGLLNLTNCDTVTQGFLAGVVPECGTSADWGTCTKGLTCGNHKLGTEQVTCK